MWEDYVFEFVCVCTYYYVCHQKHTCLHLTVRKSPRKHSADSSEFIILHVKTFQCWQALLEQLIHCFLKLRVLVRALYGIVGVSPNLLSISTSWPALNLTCTGTTIC